MNTENKTFSISCYSNNESDSFFIKILHALPIEGIAFLVGSLAIRIFSTAISFPLLGIGLSIITTRLVLKIIDCYNPSLLINLTKEACKLNKKYPKLQIIIFISTIVFSFLSYTFSFILGCCLGSFGSIILDVENYKLQQRANRKLE